MPQEQLKAVIDGLDGVVLIDMDDHFGPNCWMKTCSEYWILYELGQVAREMAIPLFIDKGREDLTDQQALNKDDLTENWIHIPRFDYQGTAEVIERTLELPRDQILLGFAGTYAESCVRKFLWALCNEKVIPEVPVDELTTRATEKPIDQQFKKGKLLYELTENKHASFFRGNSPQSLKVGIKMFENVNQFIGELESGGCNNYLVKFFIPEDEEENTARDWPVYKRFKEAHPELEAELREKVTLRQYNQGSIPWEERFPWDKLFEAYKIMSDLVLIGDLRVQGKNDWSYLTR